MKYRSGDEISASLLRSAAEREKIAKSRMMHNSFLSYSQLVEYLEFLTINSLLKYDILDRRYKIITKGIEFVDVFNKMEKLVKVH